MLQGIDGGLGFSLFLGLVYVGVIYEYVWLQIGGNVYRSVKVVFVYVFFVFFSVSIKLMMNDSCSILYYFVV